MPGRRFPLLRLFLALLALLLIACSRDEPPRFSPLPTDAVVLVIGDSLVAGTGASRDDAWPEVLARRTGWDVINAGVPGDTTAGARLRLPDLMADYRPDAVIIAVGGNDFLRNASIDDTRANLEAMIRESLSQSGHVALVAIPAVSVGRAALGRLSDHEMYAELARGQRVVLLSSVVSRVLSRVDLRSDRIHANRDGYALIAERVAEALADAGWRSP